MNEREFREFLEDLLTSAEAKEKFDDAIGHKHDDPIHVGDFSGLLTKNEGAVVKLPNGDEFQLTIVQSETGDEDLADEEEIA